MSEDLSSFFQLISEEKKKKEEEFKYIIGDLDLDDIFEEVSTLTKKNKKKDDGIKNLAENLQKQPVTQETLIEKSLGLLAEPSNNKIQQDPLTPLDQNFATVGDLQKHYKLFLERIQQQLSTLGGGGETKLKYLDDIVGIATNPSAYDQKFLQYDHSIEKFEFVDPNDYSATTIVNISGVTTYYQASNIDDYIGVNANVPVTIVLPLVPSTGKKIVVKDEGNKINLYNITVQAGAGTSVENDSSVVMKINHQSFTYFFNGNNWFLI